VLDSVVWKPTFIYHIGELFTYFDLAYRPTMKVMGMGAIRFALGKTIRVGGKQSYGSYN
jgi:hypothetical protein